MGFTGPQARIPGAYKMRAVTDKVALKAALLALADTPGLARLVPSHGEIVMEDPSGTLRRTAERFL